MIARLSMVISMLAMVAQLVTAQNSTGLLDGITYQQVARNWRSFDYNYDFNLTADRPILNPIKEVALRFSDRRGLVGVMVTFQDGKMKQDKSWTNVPGEKLTTSYVNLNARGCITKLDTYFENANDKIVGMRMQQKDGSFKNIGTTFGFVQRESNSLVDACIVGFFGQFDRFDGSISALGVAYAPLTEEQKMTVAVAAGIGGCCFCAIFCCICYCLCCVDHDDAETVVEQTIEVHDIVTKDEESPDRRKQYLENPQQQQGPPPPLPPDYSAGAPPVVVGPPIVQMQPMVQQAGMVGPQMVMMGPNGQVVTQQQQVVTTTVQQQPMMMGGVPQYPPQMNMQQMPPGAMYQQQPQY